MRAGNNKGRGPFSAPGIETIPSPLRPYANLMTLPSL